MAQKKKRGFKPPADYDPRRGAGKGGKKRPGARSVQRSEERSVEERTGRPKGDTPESGARPTLRRGSASGSPRRQEARGHRGADRSDTRDGGARVYAFDAEGRRRAGRGAAPETGKPDSAPPAELRKPVVSRGPHEPAEAVLARIDATRTTAEDVRGLTFADLGLGGNIVRTLGELGAERPFPIQAATIPDAISGRDVLGRARTGSGKTIAFGAALVERLLKLKAEGAFAGDPSPAKRKTRRGERQDRAPKRAVRKPKALILAPTRELALQIDRTVQPIARSVGFYTAQLVGGVPLDPQVHALERGVDIVIGTPGRVQDLVNRRRLDLREVLVSVIDEADHMCELGFLEPVQRVLRQTVRGGQRLLFSATLDSGVSELIAEFLKDPASHEAEEAAAGETEHRVLIVLREDKDAALLELVSVEHPPPGAASVPERIMVFCRTRAYAERIADFFSEEGIDATALHGDLSQAKRERNLARFASGKARVLVATDVAARGIHVDDVDLVLQADPPDDYKTYLHRAGRTGRAGGDGLVLTVIPRTRQKRTRELLEQAEIEPAFFGDFVPASADGARPRSPGGGPRLSDRQ
ncbi:DEAD/DEAH box helicase [Leucobacter ruminantium]|uniref:DEAD/DEAH box helicase n=1 Tax=Leucobacter ruminantium TaxID=1289170 RepID=A0A939RZ53_9MICO|nr:DEAD/DEAH box helicase [Leucobacter ruminantium]